MSQPLPPHPPAQEGPHHLHELYPGDQQAGLGLQHAIPPHHDNLPSQSYAPTLYPSGLNILSQTFQSNETVYHDLEPTFDPMSVARTEAPLLPPGDTSSVSYGYFPSPQHHNHFGVGSFGLLAGVGVGIGSTGVPSSSSTPDEPRHSIRCQWDGGRGCGSSIGTSPARISAHLRTGHDIYCTKAYRDELTACRWGNCTALLKRANMIKHLGNHFGTLRVLCLYCGRSLARLDSLRRHTKACRVAPSQSRGGRTSDFRNAAPPISDCRSTSSTST